VTRFQRWAIQTGIILGGVAGTYHLLAGIGAGDAWLIARGAATLIFIAVVGGARLWG